jgi:L-lactate utilization protein LutB
MDRDKITKLKENFKRRNIEVQWFEDFNDVKSYILETVPIDSTVGIGHSDTLQKMELTTAFINRGNVVYDKELAATKDEQKVIKKKALISDWYITGSNAISIDGRIVNVDHSGNRVASMTYGPDKVIIVIGKNKIVDSLDEAIYRVKNIASPLNAKRAGYNPPCVELNKCVDCVSKERVCNYLSIIEGQCDCNRMQILIVNADCGF